MVKAALAYNGSVYRVNIGTPKCFGMVDWDWLRVDCMGDPPFESTDKIEVIRRVYSEYGKSVEWVEAPFIHVSG